MARALARGATLSPTNPVLDLWVLIGGALTDIYALAFQIFDLSTGTAVQVFPTPSGQQSVNVSGAEHLQTGRYTGTWTVGGGENLGLHRIIWYVTAVQGGPVVQYQQDFDVLTAGLSLKGPAYCLLSDVRAEGFAATDVSDVRALATIKKVSALIERWTRRFFEPRYKNVTIDGAAGPSLWLQDPIIALDSASIDGSLIDKTTYQVFNRHITEGLTTPDDRDNPRVTFTRLTRVLNQVNIADRPFVNRQIWWPGPRNVALSGLFGFTDPDADYPAGVTPELIKQVCLTLFARNYFLANSDDAADAANAGRVKSIRTRDQSIDYGPTRAELAGASAGEFSGDPDIDAIISQYCAPPAIGSA
jgi:hypothetical protein